MLYVELAYRLVSYLADTRLQTSQRHLGANISQCHQWLQVTEDTINPFCLLEKLIFSTCANNSYASYSI